MPINITLLKYLSGVATVGYDSEVYLGRTDEHGLVIFKKITAHVQKWGDAAEREILANASCYGSYVAHDFQDNPLKNPEKISRRGSQTPESKRIHRVYRIVLKYIPGMDLQNVFDKNPTMSADHRLGLFCMMARALDEFHRNHKMVHRDVKPSNFLLTTDGQIEPLDFGLSIKKAHLEDVNHSGCLALAAKEAVHHCTQYSDIASLAYSFLLILGLLKAHTCGRKNSDFDFNEAVPSHLMKEPWHFSKPQADKFSVILEAMLKDTPKERMPLEDVASEIRQLYPEDLDISAWAKEYLEGKAFIPYDEPTDPTRIELTPIPIKNLQHTHYTHLFVGKALRGGTASSSMSQSAPIATLGRFAQKAKDVLNKSLGELFTKKNPSARPKNTLEEAPPSIWNDLDSEGSFNHSSLFLSRYPSSGGSPASSFSIETKHGSNNNSALSFFNPPVVWSENSHFDQIFRDIQLQLETLCTTSQRGSYELMQDWQESINRFVRLIEAFYKKTNAMTELMTPCNSTEGQTKKDFIQRQLEKVMEQCVNYLSHFKDDRIDCSHFRGNSQKYLQRIREELKTMGVEAEPLKVLLTQLENCIQQLGTSNPDSDCTHSADLSGCSGNTSRRGSLFDTLPTLEASVQKLLIIQKSCDDILKPPHDPNNNHYN